MKLKEFRKIVDKIDDEAIDNNNEDDKEIVLDILTEADDEYNIEIEDVYNSKLSANAVKIALKEKVDAHRNAKPIIKDRDIVIDQTNYICPSCGMKVGKHDCYCKFCGQELYNKDDLAEKEAEMTRREKRRAKREAKKKKGRRFSFRTLS